MVSFIAPHTLTARPLVVAPDDVLSVTNAAGRDPVDVVLDGEFAGRARERGRDGGPLPRRGRAPGAATRCRTSTDASATSSAGWLTSSRWRSRRACACSSGASARQQLRVGRHQRPALFCEPRPPAAVAIERVGAPVVRVALADGRSRPPRDRRRPRPSSSGPPASAGPGTAGRARPSSAITVRQPKCLIPSVPAPSTSSARAWKTACALAIRKPASPASAGGREEVSDIALRIMLQP